MIRAYVTPNRIRLIMSATVQASMPPTTGRPLVVAELPEWEDGRAPRPAAHSTLLATTAGLGNKTKTGAGVGVAPPEKKTVIRAR